MTDSSNRPEGSRRRRQAVLIVALLALAAFAGLPLAAAATAFTVTVAVDGETHEVRTQGGTVADVLERLEVELAEADVVVPSLQEPVADGSTIAVERAIRVVVLDDGQPHELVAVVATVSEALELLDLRVATADDVTPAPDTPVSDGAEVTIDRAITVDIAVDGAIARRVTAPLTTVGQALRRAGMGDLLGADVRIEPHWQRAVADGDTIQVVFPTPVTVVADGDEVTVATYGRDVAAALSDAGLEVGQDDLVAPAPAALLVGPTRVTIQRVRFVEETEEVVLEHRSERRETDDLDKGSTRVEVEGRDGLRVDTYRVTLTDGQETDRELVSEEVTREPRDEVVLVGTYVAPPPPPPPPPPAAPAAAEGASTGGSGSSGGGSGSSGGGGFLVAPGSNAAGSGATVTYSVEVEAGLGLDPGSVAATVDAALLDQRSWARDRRMERVSNPASARIRVLVASPATVDRLCRSVGLDTGGYLSCWTGRFAALNVNRWWNGVPSFSDTSLYRRYLVNHEVGHGLGFGHVGCPAQGALAPVMMQQSISLGGCRPNGWPYPG
jgi:uncharacterized protein YabE (DUF348 family)